MGARNINQDETDSDTSGPKPGTTDPKAPVDEKLYDEGGGDQDHSHKPGTTDPSGPTDTSKDAPE
jgi:hypothetical protein